MGEPVDQPVDEPVWARHLPAGMRPADVDLLAQGTLPRAWSAQWALHPDAATLHSGATGWLTAAELDARSQRAAAGLRDAGLRAGDRVLISASASDALVAVHVGALRLGLVVVPTNTAYTASELPHIAADSGARVAVLDDPARATGLTAVDVHECEVDSGVPRLDEAGPADAALICYTSGTTGRPKGAVLSHANILAGAEAVRLAWRWSRDDRLILALPLFHMHGLGVGLHGTLLAGASMVLLAKFDPDDVLDAVGRHDATLFFGVPTMYARLAASARVGELAALRLCVSGSAPLPADLHRSIAVGGGQQVLERYGMTETLMNVSNPYDGERRPGTVGLPLPGVDLRLAKGTNEIEVRGPNVFAGYWSGTDPAVFDDGWFRTGDVGAIDPDGYVRIVGRTKELIISGGYNVYPREVEEVLLTHPAVAEAAVAGTPDPEWGEVVTAYVVSRAPVTADELDAHCRQDLAAYKRPRLTHFVTELPRNALGKIERSALRPPTPPK